MRVIVEQLVGWRLAGETEVLGENLPQRHFVHHKSHMTRPGLEPGPPRWEASGLLVWVRICYDDYTDASHHFISHQTMKLRLVILNSLLSIESLEISSQVFKLYTLRKKMNTF
jgi:hypothetical protein